MADAGRRQTGADADGTNFQLARLCPTVDSNYCNIQMFSDEDAGILCHAFDRKANSPVFVRRLTVDSLSLQQVMKDASLLRQLDHENVIAFRGVVCASSECADRHQHIYTVQELLDTDLASVIRSGQLTDGHCKLFAYQLIRGLKYIHSAGIVHGNLKPDVVQVDRKSLMLKIGDFAFGNKVKAYSSCYWYASPELMIASKDCSSATDLWSVGCIVAEMATGQMLFQGSGRLEQLLKQVDCVHLSDDDWRKVLHVMPNKMLKNHPFRPRRPLRLLLAGHDHLMVQFVDRLLTFNHQQRITAEEALALSYVEEYYYPDDEPSALLPFGLAEDKDHVDESSLCMLISKITSLSGSNATKPQDNLALESHLLKEQNHSGVTQESTKSAHTGLRLDNLFSQIAIISEGFNPDGYRQADLSHHDVAFKNFRNNQDRIGDDRTPSPNILDLLNQSFESDSSGCVVTGVKGPSGKLHEADSESEKESAEISEEKLKEDLEVGNITTEDIKNFGNLSSCLSPSEPVYTAEVLPAKSYLGRASVTLAASNCSSLITRRECQKLLRADTVLQIPTEASSAATKIKRDFDQSRLSKNSDCENVVQSPKTCLQPPFVLMNIHEDSNKYSCADNADSKQKLKSDSEAVRLSRKLILDKLESEKKSQQAMSRMAGNLTSEEFDELYRLPTEHLRKDKSQNERIRQRHSHEWPRCGRHPDDSVDRYGYYKEDRLHAEGACGGHDYYDDMQASFPRSSIEFDLDPLYPENTAEQNQALTLEDPDLLADLRFVRPAGHGTTPNRETSSSPESPASPRTVQTGARPKKSPKKHRAV